MRSFPPFKFSATLIGVLVATVAIVIAPWFNVANYSSLAHTTSELGAQGAPNSWLMNLGFVAFGIGITFDAGRQLKTRRLVALACLVFGLSMILTGVFSHRPIDPLANYDKWEDDLHSLFSGLVGLAFSLAALAAFFETESRGGRAIHIGALASAIILPLGMTVCPGYAGLLQRVMFGISFIWLVRFLPMVPRSQRGQPHPETGQP